MNMTDGWYGFDMDEVSPLEAVERISAAVRAVMDKSPEAEGLIFGFDDDRCWIRYKRYETENDRDLARKRAERLEAIIKAGPRYYEGHYEGIKQAYNLFNARYPSPKS